MYHGMTLPTLSLLISSAGAHGLRCNGSLSNIGGTEYTRPPCEITVGSAPHAEEKSAADTAQIGLIKIERRGRRSPQVTPVV